MKILFVSKPNSDNFIRNYTDYLTALNSNYKLLITRSPEEVWNIESGYDWVMYEWANDLTAQCCTKKHTAKVCVRIHDHEVRKGRIHNIKWDNVDRCWFINQQIRAEFKKSYTVDDFFLPNAVDPAPFNQNLSSTKKIGLLSISARTRKRFDRAIQLMELLPDWELTIRTEDFNPELEAKKSIRYMSYLKRMAETAGNVRFDFRDIGFINNGYGKEDVNDFFQDKDCCIVTSSHEGFCYALAESALCGCMPVTYNWEFGIARTFWATYTHDTIEAMAEVIKSYKPSPEYRDYILNNFAPGVLAPRLLNELGR